MLLDGVDGAAENRVGVVQFPAATGPLGSLSGKTRAIRRSPSSTAETGVGSSTKASNSLASSCWSRTAKAVRVAKWVRRRLRLPASV